MNKAGGDFPGVFKTVTVTRRAHPQCPHPPVASLEAPKPFVAPSCGFVLQAGRKRWKKPNRVQLLP